MRNFLNFTIFSIILLSACASDSDAKAKWYVKDVSMKKREWRYCSEDLDGPEKADKGFCYISQRCIDKAFRKERCEPVPLFCVHGDFECLRKNKFPTIKRGN